MTTSKQRCHGAAQHGLSTGSPSSKQRPNSMQPWASSRTPAPGELHSAAHNAKLAKAARDREASRARAVQSRQLVAAMLQSTPAVAPEDVAAALQQQLNAMGLSGSGLASRQDSAQQQHSSTEPGAKQATGVGADRVLPQRTTGAAAVVVAATLGGSFGSIDGNGRLVASAGCPANADAAHAQMGALTATGHKVSLRQQSAAAATHSSSMAGLLRTSSVGLLPVRSLSGNPSAGQAGQQQQQQPERQAAKVAVQQSPTAEELRAMLKSSSAGSGKLISQLAVKLT